jgi:DNA-directed DNA polymerase III PolC
MNFLQDIQSYDDAMLPGVRLPQISIDSKYYDLLKIPTSSDNFTFLKTLCYRSLDNKNLNKKEYVDRLEMELQIFHELDFVDYVLLNWDILNFCHENNIPTGPGRGSAAGSLVLFLVDVTKVDPIRYGLFFERFVSKSRAKKIIKNDITYLDGSLLPDVDNDISYDRRSEVIKYIENKHFGKTSKILTLNTLSSKLCIKECGKIVGGYSETEVNEISDLIPKQFGRVFGLEEAAKENDKFKKWCDDNPKLFKIAKKIEGLNKNTGVHPSGIAISYYKIDEVCPVQKTSDGDLVSGYDMNYVAELMVKFDVLGLRTLTVVNEVCKMLNMDMTSIDPEDPFIYENLQNLKTPQGLFQIEADTNFKVCKKVTPKNLFELSDVMAIARPGALSYLDEYINENTKKMEELDKMSPALKDILKRTKSVPLYQEQAMAIGHKVFNFSLDEAEQIRRCVGKKKIDEMKKWKPRIYENALEHNLSTETADFYWKLLEESANYSFNLSHSASYAILAAWTTYLKFKHPKEFFLALLKLSKFEPDSHKEINKISKELMFFDIELLPPDLAKSAIDFNIEDKNIRFGLNSIKGVSEKTLESLQQFRETNTPNKFDIFITAKQAGINIGLLSSLIQAGTLSSYTHRRSRLVLEAQTFNLLTDKEKKYAYSIGDKYNYDILTIVSECAFKNKNINQDGKPFMSDKRKTTFKKKYDEYKKIYDQNKNHEKFANWVFENKLLGYTPSIKLKTVFEQPEATFTDTLEFQSTLKNDLVKIVGVVDDVYKGKSKKSNNQFFRIALKDEVGTVMGLFMDGGKKARLSEYLEDGLKIPEKENIVVFTGRKGDDVLWIENIAILDDKIYMKLSDVE